jgi:uncharacterized membrane protein YgcG
MDGVRMHVFEEGSAPRRLRCLLACAFLASPLIGSPARADSTVVDRTGLMTQNAIAHIDNRNALLENATGTSIAVLVEHGSPNETSSDAATAAQQVFSSSFGVLVWVATDTRQADIVFLQPALKWVTPDQQAALHQQLAGSLQYCCPSDTLPALVDTIAADLESGAKLPPDPRNYVRDDLGLLDDLHISTIAAREQQLESTRGLGVGVILMEAQPGKSAADSALLQAQSLDVKGAIAAVVWVARSGGSLTFSMEPAANFANAIPDSTVANINAAFQADMQSGQLADAIAAAVDRTAAALQASSTPMPSVTALGSQSPGAALASSQPEAQASASAIATSSAPGTSRASTALLILIGLAIIVLIVTMALRRRNQSGWGG